MTTPRWWQAWQTWETWETNTEIGPRILDAWDHEGSVFLVVRSLEVYKELERLNGRSMCRWLSGTPPSNPSQQSQLSRRDNDDDDDDTRSIVTVEADAAPPDVGVICLRAPRFSYEKSKAGLPSCFLFGRRSSQRNVDVHLGGNSKKLVSRVHFALGLKNGHWAIRNVGPLETHLNRDIPLKRGTPSVALRPGRCKIVQVADIELEFYCRDPRIAADYLSDTPSLPLEGPRESTDPSGTSTLTTTPGLQPTEVPQNPDERFYILDEQPLPSRTKVQKCLGLEAWTCARYAIKIYPSSPQQQDALARRLALLGQLPVSEEGEPNPTFSFFPPFRLSLSISHFMRFPSTSNTDCVLTLYLSSTGPSSGTSRSSRFHKG